MAKAKKLPSGNWRVRVYSHTTPDGQKKYESFTASTKQEAEMLAAKFANTKHRISKGDMTVSDAIDGYIKAKTNVLSPSTIKGYRRMQRCNYGAINSKKVKKLTSADMQVFISQLSTELSPKATKNVYGLLSASIALYYPDIAFKVSLPTTAKQTPKSPSDDDIRALYNSALPWLKKCIALGAFGGMRRGEIAALKYGDIEDDTIHIHADMVQDEHNKWIYKDMPKTKQSVRSIRLPHQVIELLGTGQKDDYVIGYPPSTISNMFCKLRDKLGLSIRLHDMRHYYATTGSMLGIPDIVIADMGGWRHDSPIMKNLYQGNIAGIADGYAKKMNDHFEKVLK